MVSQIITIQQKSRLMTKENGYMISELAKEFDVSSRTIRFYEEKKLLTPTRTEGNQRRYSKRDKRRLQLILRGKHFGLTLAEIRDIIGLPEVEKSESEQIKTAYLYGKKYLKTLRERIEELQELEEELIFYSSKALERLEELEGKRSVQELQQIVPPHDCS